MHCTRSVKLLGLKNVSSMKAVIESTILEKLQLRRVKPTIQSSECLWVPIWSVLLIFPQVIKSHHFLTSCMIDSLDFS